MTAPQASFPGYNLFTAIKVVLSKYAVFSGRATRSEFWYWTLFCFIVDCLMFSSYGSESLGFAALTALITLFLFLPSLAVTVRRLHDTGKSGWTWFLGLIPIVGIIILVIFYIKDSQPQTNQYGPSEKYPE